MHEQHCAVFLHLLEGTEHRAVVRLPTLGFVDHEFLERRETAIDHALDLILVLVPAGNADVEGVVDERFAFGFSHPVVRGLIERFTGVGNREIDERRHAAARSCPSPGFIVVSRHRSAKRQFEVNMHIEDARNYVMVFGVHHLRGLVAIEIHAEGGDFLASYSDVADKDSGRRHHVAALDDPIKAHGAFPSSLFPLPSSRLFTWQRLSVPDRALRW